MKRHVVVFTRLRSAGVSRFAVSRPRPGLFSLALVVFLTVTTLACGFLEADSHLASPSTIIRNRLPTLTPTLRTELAATVAPANIVATPASSPIPGQNVKAANSPVVDAPVPPAEGSPTTTLAALITETPISRAISVTVIPDIETDGWSFTGVRLYTGQNEEGLLLYGDLTNNTGATQKLGFISAIFYDAQGQVIADAKNIDVYWPLDLILPGGQLPFEMTVSGIQNTANFNLSVEAEPSTEILRQDFEFSEVDQWSQSGKFCVTGQLRNKGDALQSYLVIATILYDAQDNIVNFSHQQEASFEQMIGDHPLDVEVCIGSSNQNIARYALRAWGQ